MVKKNTVRSAQTKKAQVIVVAREFSRSWVLFLQTKEDRGAHWQNVTGSAEGAESFEEAGLRELFEETGIRANNLINLNYEFEYNDRWSRQVTEKAFLVNLSEMPKITISKEHQNYIWRQCDFVSEKSYGFPTNFHAFTLALKKLAL